MHQAVETLRLVAGQADSVLQGHAGWMVANSILAMVPLVLAVVLFRPGARRGWWFWPGVVAFVLFLPNAPYVLTDVVHLFDDIRHVHSDLQVLGLVLPLYLAFFLVGFCCYVLALRRLQHYLAIDAPRVPWWALLLTLHALCSVGIYLGRVLRFNSWDVLFAPLHLASSADSLNGGLPLVLILCTFVVLTVGTAAANLTIDGLDRWLRPIARRGRLVVERFGLAH
jgi:uncharacterized membrane protein